MTRWERATAIIDLVCVIGLTVFGIGCFIASWFDVSTTFDMADRAFLYLLLAASIARGPIKRAR